MAHNIMTTETISESIMTKIKALLAMAEHANSNPNEAALALERAQALLLAHNLTRADIQTADKSTPVGIGQIDGVETAGFTWKSRLLYTIAKSNLCTVVVSGSVNTWHLFGQYDNVKSVLTMYQWVSHQLEMMAVKDWAIYHESGGYEHVKTWKAGFFEGANSAIRDRLDKPFQAFADGNGRALVVQSKEMLNAATHKVFPRLVTRHIAGSRSSDGRASGRVAGQNVSMTPQTKLGHGLRLNAGY
jgi:hypothetical protein